jgi:hypothetical protein
VPGKTPPDASGAGLTPDPQEPSDVPAAIRSASPGRARLRLAATARFRRGKPAAVPFQRGFSQSRPFPGSCRPAPSSALRAPRRSSLLRPPRRGVSQRSRLGRGRTLAGPSCGPFHLRPWGAETDRPGSAGLGAEAACSVRRIPRPIPPPLGARRAWLETPLRIFRAGFGLLDLRCGGLAPIASLTVSPPLSAAGRKTREGLRGVCRLIAAPLLIA